jgi:sugar phosphate permease
MVMLSWGPLAPFLIDSFSITHTQLGLFTTIVFLPSLLFSVFAGWLTDRIGIRLLLSIPPGAMGLSYIVFSYSTALSQAYVIVFLIGFSYGLINPTTIKSLRLWFPSNIRGTVISIKQAGVTLGGAAGAIILPSLSLVFGWRKGVSIAGLVLIIGAIISYVFYRDPPRVMPPSRAEALHFSQLWDVIKNRDLLLLSLLCAAFAAIQHAVSTYLVIYLVEVRSLSVIEAGKNLLAVNIAGTIGRIVWGLISDKLFYGQRRPVLMIIGIIIALLSFSIGILGTSMPDWLSHVVFFLLGFTTHGWHGVYFAAASEMVDDHLIASGIGWSLALTYISTVISPPLFGFIVEITLSYTMAWVIFSIACGSSVLLALPIRERRRDCNAKYRGERNIRIL